jgi:hypothetical protein
MVFDYFCERTPRSYVETRETSLVWNYKFAGEGLRLLHILDFGFDPCGSDKFAECVAAWFLPQAISRVLEEFPISMCCSVPTAVQLSVIHTELYSESQGGSDVKDALGNSRPPIP